MTPTINYGFDRYARQMLIGNFGEAGQERLRDATVLVAGAGGLGSPIAMYLAAAGVGTIRIIDRDTVELSNLNRQLLHGDSDIGSPKAESAEKSLRAINGDIQIEAIEGTLSESNIAGFCDGCDVIVDALDNFATRYLLNACSLANNIPMVHGGVYGLEGRATTFIPGQSGCFRCLYPEGSDMANFPIIGVTPGVIGAVQATETIKFLVGIGGLLVGRLLIYDAFDMRFMEINYEQNPACPDCGKTIG